MNIEEIAKVCHEVNRAYCNAIGDNSQINWEDAPQWQKDSAIHGVKFSLDHPELTSKDQHDEWLAHKKADGWTYGEVKNAELKQHPCFLPYDQLPVEQKVKDYLFKTVVTQLSNL